MKELKDIMSRRPRLNIPGGTYYVVQHGGARRPIFSCEDDYALFESLVVAGLKRHGATAYAYCWTPDAIHLVLRTGDTPIGRLMQGLTSRFARSIHLREGESGHFFRTRYQAALVDSESYLAKLVHYVHHIPVLTEVATDLAAYGYSSHRAYLGETPTPWVNTRSVLGMCDSDQDELEAYVAMMARAPTDHDVELFRNGGEVDLRVIGGPDFLASLPRHARKYRSKLSLDQIIGTVTRALDVDRDHVMSSSRQRDLALARALIAWFAIERRVATLTEVARRLNRDPSTLSVAISRYRVLRQDLFRLDSMHYLTPLGPQDESPDSPDWRVPEGAEEARVG
jgi:REP element-mobilizing transposase RayT